MVWKKIVNEKDYKLWYNKKNNRNVSVFKNRFSTQKSPTGQSKGYICKDKTTCLKRANAYMKRNK